LRMMREADTYSASNEAYRQEQKHRENCRLYKEFMFKDC
jgi:hypothetical protein